MNWIRALAVLAGTSIALAASPAWSQAPPPMGPLEYPTQKPPLIRAQVELGARFAGEAIAVLENASEVEQLERAKALVSKSYLLLRYATAGIEMITADTSTTTNPGLKIALEWIWAARQRNIVAGIAIGNSVAWPGDREQFKSQALDLLAPVPELAQRASLLIR
jgi:hypothetical protein